MKSMPNKRKTPLRLAVLGLTLAVIGASVWILPMHQQRALGADAAGVTVQPPIANEVIDVAGQMDKLIRDHKVDELAALTIPADKDVAKLARWRTDYVTDMKESEELRAKQYDEDVKAAQDFVTKGKFDEAMDKTVQAYSITKDQAAFIDLPWLKDLALKVADQASAYEKEGRWLESLQLYSDLNNLFEIDVRYKPDMQRLARRTRLLAMYTPKIIYDMRQAYAERIEKEKGPDAVPLPKEEVPTFARWQDQVEKIDIGELYTAVDTARAKWVEGTTYEILLKGGVDALRLFLTTPELAQEFPELAKAANKDKFNAALDAALAKIDPTGTNRITRDEMHDIVDDIMKANGDSIKLPSEVAIMEFTDGAMEKLDPFTAVIWPHERPEFEKNIRGIFGGVGIQISMETGKLKVVSPLEDTPAFKAGIQAGDEVTAIDGKSTSGINIDTAVHEIMGKPDTQVNLTIRREGKKELIEYSLTRAIIHVATVKGVKRDANDATKWNYMMDPDTKIGYIRITGFQEDTHKEMDDAIEDLKSHGVRGIVLDLRFNPGGLLNAATAMSDDFLNASTKPIVSTKGKTVPEQKITPEDGTIIPMNMPLVILVNQYSASASEIFSGAMKDFNRGMVVGNRSFGKGSVQNVIEMDDNSIIKLTTQYYYLPNGESLHRRDGHTTWGVEPDITVPMTPVQINALLKARRDSEIIGAAPVVAPATNAASQPAADAKKDEPLIDTQLDTALLMLRLQLVQQQP
jgi:carboxyl-terminal processing protease